LELDSRKKGTGGIGRGHGKFENRQLFTTNVSNILIINVSKKNILIIKFQGILIIRNTHS
jgi:hypothetical protein